eukprot:jgi/Mesen1/4341/ME000022S03629
MSGRMVKRLLKQQEKEAEHGLDQAEEVDEEEDADASTSMAVNPFDLLGGELPPSVLNNHFALRHLQDEEEEDNEEDQTVGTSSAAEKPATPAAVLKKVKSKKKKGKSKGKGKPSEVAEVDLADKDVDELCKDFAKGSSLQKPTQSAGKERDESSSHRSSSSSSVLAINIRHLKAEDELKRIFGSKVINSAGKREDHGAGARRRGGLSGRRGGKVTLRKFMLVQPQDYWPPWDGGLTMECTGTKEGYQFFKYTMSDSYLSIQRKYEECVASHDPNNLANLVNHYPYHVEALLALAEVYKQMGEFQTSADLLERCLYSLECAWHPWFNPSLGTCRLPYSEESNRPLFYALFRHMQHLGRRGCHRTALEVCKLLLSLDPEDPLGALFSIDYYALRAEQYEWLHHFCDHYDSQTSLALFPNFAYSLALARYHLEHQQGGAGRSKKDDARDAFSGAGAGAGPDSSSNRGGAGGEGGSDVPASELIAQALMLHPTVLQKVVDKAPVKVDGEWSLLLKHSVFARATAGSPSLEHLVELYVERNSMLWRAQDVQAWLRSGAASMVAMADKPGGSRAEGELASWAIVRKEAFPSAANEYRHLFLHDFSDAISTLPPEEVQAMQAHAQGHGGGMLPRAEMMLAPPQPAAPVGPTPMDPEGRNPYLVFLQALLPWNDFGVDLQGQDPLQAEEAEDDIAVRRALHDAEG